MTTLRLAKLTLVPTGALVAAGLTLLTLADAQWFGLIYAAHVVAFATLGVLVAARQPANPIASMLSALALLIAFYIFGVAYAFHGVLNDSGLPAWREVAWVVEWAWPLADWVPAILLLLFFPHGRLLSSRWRWVIWLAALGLALTTVGSRPQAPSSCAIAGSRTGARSVLRCGRVPRVSSSSGSQAATNAVAQSTASWVPPSSGPLPGPTF